MFHLPNGYQENAQASHEGHGVAFWDGGKLQERWQVPVYRLAAGLAKPHYTVLDIGSGTGAKLTRYLASSVKRAIGADQASGTAIARAHFPDGEWIEADFSQPSSWESLARCTPDLVICADVIEHVDDPALLLRRLRDVMGGGRLLISTPDRSRLEGASALGPPQNERHIREWTPEEFQALASEQGLFPAQTWHVRPRTYQAARRDLARAVFRLVSGRHPLDRRSSMVFLMRQTVDTA